MFEMVPRIRCPPLVDPPLWFPPLVHAVASSATAAISPIRAFEFRIYLSLSVRSAIRYAPGASARPSLPEIPGGAQGRALQPVRLLWPLGLRVSTAPYCEQCHTRGCSVTPGSAWGRKLPTPLSK